jgi:hypothetical protein
LLLIKYLLLEKLLLLLILLARLLIGKHFENLYFFTVSLPVLHTNLENADEIIIADSDLNILCKQLI